MTNALNAKFTHTPHLTCLTALRTRQRLLFYPYGLSLLWRRIFSILTRAQQEILQLKTCPLGANQSINLTKQGLIQYLF